MMVPTAAESWTDELDWQAYTLTRLAPEDVPDALRRGHADPAWDQFRAASYPDRLVLSTLSAEAELKDGLRRAGIGPGSRVLDAGCGPGVISRFLLDIGADEVLAIDADPAMLERAEALPFRPEWEGRLRFAQADLRQELPVRQRSFDVVLMGDVWLTDAFARARAVLRPGGSIVVKATHPIASLYAWDHAFDMRIRLARLDAYDRSTRAGAQPDHEPVPEPASDATARTGLGCLRELGPWSELSAWSVLVERTAPLPAVDAEHLRQSLGIFSGPLIRDLAAADDWERLVSLYDPSSPAYLFDRDDLHIIELITFLRAVL